MKPPPWPVFLYSILYGFKSMEAGKSGWKCYVFQKGCFEEWCNTIHDLLSHIFGGSITFDCVLIPLCLCSVLALDSAWQMHWNWWIDRKSKVNRDLWPLPVFPCIFSFSGRVQKWISIKCWDQSKVMTELMYWWCALTASPLQYSAWVSVELWC